MKGIAMLLAVIGHSFPDAVKGFWIAGPHSFAEFSCSWIYSFHMAVFFFAAGFLFIPKIADSASVGGVVWKRFRRLMIPYFFYSICYLFLKSILSAYADHPLEENAFLMIFLGDSPSFGCWFLWVIFVISLLFLTLRRIGVKWLVAFGLVLYIIGFFIGSNCSLIGRVGDVMRFSLWFALGGLVAVNYDKIKKYLAMPALGIASFAILTLLQFLHPIHHLGLVISFAKTICGIEMIFSLSYHLAEKCHDSKLYSLFKLIGDYCMDIYLLSMFVLVPLRILFVNFGFMNHINYYVYLVISTAFGLLIPYLASKYVIRKNKILSLLLIGS